MENIVSNFLVSTCRVHKKFDATKHCALISFDDVHSFGPFDTRTVSGSRAEFYIQPVNSCIHDLDIMLTVNPFLALDPSCKIVDIAGDLYDRIICYKHESYEQNKSFVRLRDPIVGVYDWSSEEYRFGRLDVPANVDPMGFLPRELGSGSSPASFLEEFMEQSTTRYNRNGELTDMSKILPRVLSTSGPALTAKFQDVGLISEVDYVFSIFCPNWPLAAEEWPIRTRHFGWPNSATISKVIHEGYDVVAAAHRDMRKDEYQRRLSFSRAEIILIQSWTPTQQIVYHLIRYFAKREIILKEGPENEEVVCTYHLKTLMLWSCEDKSAEWWDTSSVVAICCKMLRKLCECLKQKRCPNYFIPGANLLGHGMNSEVLNRTINTLDYYKDEKRITEWFIAHYILPVYQKHCNKEETVLTEEMVEICRICVCAYNKEQQLSDLNDVISLCAEKCFLSVNDSFNCRENHKMNIAFSIIPMKRFPDMSFASKMSNTLADYMKALILFQMSQSIVKPKFQFEVDILYEIWVHIIRRHLNFVEVFDFMQLNFGVLNKSELYFNRTEQMMKHLAFGYSKDEICFAKMISILYLHKSSSCHDTSSHQIETASRMYMAALLYDIGRLQCAVNICSHVTTEFKENEHCGDVRYLKVSSLLFVDDLAKIAGFLLLRRNLLQIRRKRIFLLSPELFAHYLFFQCNSERFNIMELDGITSSSEADCCLAAMLRYNILRCTDNNIRITPTYSTCTEAAEESTDIVLPGKTDIGEILARISNDYMTSFYASISEEFGTKFNLASCYEALSLYLYGRYEDVIALCETILEEPEYDSELEKFQFLNVNVSLHFIAYFDEDIQALVGFQLLVLRSASKHHEGLENSLTDDSRRVPRLPDNDRDLIFHLMSATFYHDDRNSKFISSCKTFCETFNPILTKQFVGNYLKLRCLLDLGFPLFEVKSAFQCLKSSLLFEHILVHLMRQKIVRRYCGTSYHLDFARIHVKH